MVYGDIHKLVQACIFEKIKDWNQKESREDRMYKHYYRR